MADALSPQTPEVTPSVETPVAEPVAAPSGASAELLARAEQFGLDKGTFQSDRDVASAIFDIYEREKPYSEYGRQALAGNPLKAPTPEPAPEPEPAESAFDLDKHFSEAWKVPELSPGAQWAMQHGALVENEQGVLVAKPGLEQVALPYLREIQEHQQARAALSEEFNRNPVRFIYDKMIPALRHELRGDFEQLDRETKTKTQAEAFEQKFTSENKDWLYAPDGQLSPAGIKFKQSVDQWRSKGINDPEALAQLAMAVAKPAAAPASADPNAPVELTPKSGNGQPHGANGQFVSKQAAFLENVKRQSAAGGGRSAPSDEDYKPANRAELSDMFNQAYRRHKAGAA